MKRILFVCFLLAATCPSVFIPATATAKAPAPAPAVTLSAFTTKVNQLDAYIAASNMTAAQATWLEVHTMMLDVLAVSKTSIHSATTPADKTRHETILEGQRTLYYEIWELKKNLAPNRIPLHTKLGEFGATIY